MPGAISQNGVFPCEMTKWCIDHYSTVKTTKEIGFIEEKEEVE